MTVTLSEPERRLHAAALAVSSEPIVVDGPLTPDLALVAQAYGIADRVVVETNAGRRDASAPAGRGRPTTALPSMPTPRLEGERVVIVSKALTHYRVPLFNELRRLLEASGAEGFRAVSLTERSDERSWMEHEPVEFDHVELSPSRVVRTSGGALWTRGFTRSIASFDPTIVVCGGFSPGIAGQAARLGRTSGFALGIWSGEIESRPTARSRLRRFQRRRILDRADFGIAYGTASAAYLRGLRPGLPVVVGRNSTVLPTQRAHRSTCPPEILCVSRAVPGKRVDVAVRAVRETRHDVRLTVVGDGPELPRLRVLAGGDDRIRFLGALSAPETRQVFETADVFLFPSQIDVFGLVLVEAMAAGLAIVTTRAPGAVRDLCEPERNAILVEPDVPSWVAAIERLAESPDLANRLGSAAAATVRERWTIGHAAQAMMCGLHLGVLTRAAR